MVRLAHRSREKKHVYLSLSAESDGTRRLLALLSYIFKILDNGSILICDELGANLHTLACDALLKLFSNATINRRGAQLIATTHDTNLLHAKALRRDQVWFAEKDEQGATHFYPLTDIRTRAGDNLEKGYLQGRFGAVPFSGSIEGLFGAL